MKAKRYIVWKGDVGNLPSYGYRIVCAKSSRDALKSIISYENKGLPEVLKIDVSIERSACKAILNGVVYNCSIDPKEI